MICQIMWAGLSNEYQQKNIQKVEKNDAANFLNDK